MSEYRLNKDKLDDGNQMEYGMESGTGMGMPGENGKDSGKNKRQGFWKGVICGVLVSVCVVFAGSAVRSHITETNNEEIAASVSDVLTSDKMDEIQKIIDRYYLYEDEIDADALAEGIYKGYVEALGDPYTVYYTEEETTDLMESISGTYSGVGAALLQDADSQEVVISKVYKDSPAEEAGLKDGDVIYQVDDHVISDESLDEVVSWIRGEEGTDVTICVRRDGEELELTATRRVLETPTVEYEMKEDQIGYIYVTEFDDVTTDQFENALNDLESQGMQGLIIDLRSNPGGNVTTVTEMMNLILPKGTTLTIKDKYGNEETYSSDGTHEFTKPLVVLVNQYSASASEIFCGAVQDFGTGTIVGVTTYGKGVVQQIEDLGDGTSLKVTIAEYFTANGRSINGVGVTPDVEVEYEPDEENPDADNQLDKAMEVIREQL